MCDASTRDSSESCLVCPLGYPIERKLAFGRALGKKVSSPSKYEIPLSQTMHRSGATTVAAQTSAIEPPKLPSLLKTVLDPSGFITTRYLPASASRTYKAGQTNMDMPNTSQISWYHKNSQHLGGLVVQSQGILSSHRLGEPIYDYASHPLPPFYSSSTSSTLLMTKVKYPRSLGVTLSKDSRAAPRSFNGPRSPIRAGHTHLGDFGVFANRPFKCHQCFQSFKRRFDLKRHKEIHKMLKPFSCPVCDKSLSRKDALRRHMRNKDCNKFIPTQPASPV